MLIILLCTQIGLEWVLQTGFASQEDTACNVSLRVVLRLLRSETYSTWQKYKCYFSTFTCTQDVKDVLRHTKSTLLLLLLLYSQNS